MVFPRKFAIFFKLFHRLHSTSNIIFLNFCLTTLAKFKPCFLFNYGVKFLNFIPRLIEIANYKPNCSFSLLRDFGKFMLSSMPETVLFSDYTISWL